MTARPVARTAVSADGTPIAYRSGGVGSPLLLVHGTTSGQSRWDTLRPVLEPHATVHTVDRRGRGASGDGEVYALEREVEDLVAVIEHIAGEAGTGVDVFGHSFGALVAVEAALWTTALRKLAVYEPPIGERPAVTEEGLRTIEELAETGRGEEALETFFALAGFHANDVAAMRAHPAWPVRVANAHTISREIRAVLGYELRAERFRDLDIEVLVLVGSESAPAWQSRAENLASTLPRGQLAILEGQAHEAIDTAPELFCDALLRFFDHTA